MEITFNIRCDDCQEWSSAHYSITGTETRVRCPHCGAAYLITVSVAQLAREEEEDYPMATTHEQGVYTVVGHFDDFEEGTFYLRVLDGYIGGSWEYVCPAQGPLLQREHEARILHMAYEEWSVPDTRAYDAITFTWSDERTKQKQEEIA